MNSLPETLRAPLQETLAQLGDNSPLRSAQALSGGCINHATRVETDRDIYFLKWNPDPLPGLFHCEAEGLRILASTSTVRIPTVLAYAEKTGVCPAFIMLEWLEGDEKGDQAILGEQLAALHRSGTALTHPASYGLDHDNYLGSTRQYNQFQTDWPTFFIERRLLPLRSLCQQRGSILPERNRRFDRLITHIPGLLNRGARHPCLIHGDLWAGNVIPSSQGLALVDPAVSYSDREAEIAYTELFGGFNARFYAAYQATWPLETGYADRRDLYNLYHLLNHLYLFGESYGYQVDKILRRYT